MKYDNAVRRKYEVKRYLYRESCAYFEENSQKYMYASVEIFRDSQTDKKMKALEKSLRLTRETAEGIYAEYNGAFRWFREKGEEASFEAYADAFPKASGFSFENTGAARRAAEELYFICLLMQKEEKLPHRVSEDFVEKLFDAAGFSMDRFRWVSYVRRNAVERWFGQEKDILKSNNAEALFEKMTQKESLLCLDEMGWEQKRYLRKYLNRLEKELNMFVVKRMNPLKRAYHFFNDEVVEVKPIEVFFLFWLIVQKDPAYCLLTLYDDLFREAGWKVSITSPVSMEDAILYFVIKNKRTFEQWVRYEQDWVAKKGTYTPDLVLNGEVRTCTEGEKNFIFYEDWRNKMVFPGLEVCDNVQKTRNSLSFVEKNVKNWNPEVENLDLIRKLLDAQTRRRWYFYRLLDMIIQHQMKQGTEYVFLGSEWRKDKFYVSWVDKYGFIVPNRILTAFNCFFDSNEDAVTKSASASGLGNGERAGSNTLNELLWQEIKTEKKRYRAVSKNLLLMTILVADVFGLELDRAQVNKILFNSRYSFADTPFDAYFMETHEKLQAVRQAPIEERIRISQKAATAVREVYEQKQVHIFNRSFLGKE